MKFFRYILFLINIGTSLLLVITALSRIINPQLFWFFEFIALAYPIYVLLNLGFIIFWLFSSHKKYVLISLIGFVLSISTFFDTFSFSGTPELKPVSDSVTIITYNVNAFNYNGWRGRAKTQAHVFEFLKQEHPDIICFQEFHHDRQEKYNMIDSIRKQLGLRYMQIHRLHEIKGRYFYGNVIFSKFPIIKTGVFLYQKTGNTTLWVDVVMNSDTIRIYNNHLESYRLQQDNIQAIEMASSGQEFESTKLRKVGSKLKRAIQKRGQQTQELLEAMKETNYKTILCGDFNAPPYSFTYNALRSEHSLQDAFLEASSGLGGTLNWRLPSKRLDYILLSDSFLVKRYTRPQLPISDHFPISVTYYIQN